MRDVLLRGVFFIYIDWTLEDLPRPFYVGKGVIGRIRNRQRNTYWQNIVSKYGWRREVILATKDEQFAFEEESRYIDKLGTFEDGTLGRYGANLTKGGEGRSGSKLSDETKMKMSKAHLGKIFSEETRQKLSLANRNQIPWSKGRRQTPEHTEKIRTAQKGKPCHFKGKKHTAIAIDNMRKAQKKGVNNHNAKLSQEQVDEIRHAYNNGEYQIQIAKRYGVTQGVISRIITRKTYE